MNGTDNNHLSPDQLEDAVRGHLSPADLAAVEAHCAACTPCRRAYDEELRIAQGTRAWARAAMKQRLARRIAHTPQRQIPWPRVLATAALILVAVGVGILYQWLQSGKEPVPAFTDNVRPQIGDRTPEDRQTSAPAPGAQDLSGYAAAEPQPKTMRTRKESAPLPRSDRPPLLKSSHVPEEPAAAPLAAIQNADEGDAIQAVGASEGLILWGTRITAPPVEKKNVEETRATEVMKDKATFDSMVGRSKSMGGAGVRSHTFIIDQRVPLMFLDQKHGHQGTTAAKVTRSGDTLHLTLFLEPLLTPAVIRSALVRECPPDSFQVIFPDGTVLGYRAPSGFLR